MRVFDVRYIPDGGSFHVFDEVIGAEPDIQRSAIHKMKLVDDELGVVLYELKGDADRFRELMADLASGFDYQITEIDNSIFFYSPFVPNDTLTQLMRITDDFELFRVPPMRFVDGGHLQSTYVGTHAVFEQAMDAVPDDVTIILDRKSPYMPEGDQFRAQLTDKQRTVLLEAITRGYYEVPRTTTCAEIGEALGLSAATVGEHLRKAERGIMHRLVDGLTDGPDPASIPSPSRPQV